MNNSMLSYWCNIDI